MTQLASKEPRIDEIGRSVPIGATVDAHGVNFSLYWRHATGVELLFFDRVDDGRPARMIRMDTLHEMAAKSGVGIVLDESRVPLTPEVRAAGELLGIDPLHVANEGKAVLGVRPAAAADVLEALRAHPLGRRAAIVGRAVAERPGSVILDTGFGRRLLSEPDGEPMPRIC